MQLIASFYAIYAICLICRNLFVRRKLAAPLDSLRTSHLPFVPVGLAVGFILSIENNLAAVVGDVKEGLLGVILVWFGIVTGLRFDFRRLGRRASRHHALEGLQVLGTAALVFFLALLWRPVLRYQMGIAAEPALVALVLATLATTLRLPDRVFYVRSDLSTPDVENAPAGPLITNAAGMTLLTVLYPYCAGGTVLELGPLTLVSTGSFWALYACVGVLLGLLLTLVFSTGCVSAVLNDFQAAFASPGHQFFHRYRMSGIMHRNNRHTIAVVFALHVFQVHRQGDRITIDKYRLQPVI